jgi:hypothetical protein
MGTFGIIFDQIGTQIKAEISIIMLKIKKDNNFNTILFRHFLVKL